jgi:hypothetical protein
MRNGTGGLPVSLTQTGKRWGSWTQSIVCATCGISRTVEPSWMKTAQPVLSTTPSKGCLG